MIIKLPWVESFDTLNLPDDFEQRVRESFGTFTTETREDYVNEDKLMYIDNLRECCLHDDTDNEEAVKKIILESEKYSLDEYGELPDRDAYWNLEFLAECYGRGKAINLRDTNYENNHHDNDKTLKVIAEIIKIVMNWEYENVRLKNER